MTTDATPGVTTVVEAPEPAKPRELTSLSEAQYAEWRKTGEIPAEEPATLTEKPKPAAAEKRTAAAEPKNGVEPPPVTKLGYGDLRKKVREQEAEIARLKSAPREESRREVPPEPEKKEAAAETVRAKPQATDKDKDGKPKYQTYEDYVEDLADWKAEQKLADYDKKRDERTKAEAAQRELQKANDSWTSQVESARSKHADFDKVALDPEMVIPQGSAVEQWVLNSEIGTGLLYYLGQHRDELAAIHKMHPVQAARFLTALEAELSGENEAEPEKKAPATDTRTTKAPPPTREVGGRGTAAVDELTKAVADDDTRAYINAANRRDIAKKKR